MPTISEADVLPLLLDTAADVKESLKILNKYKVQQVLFPVHLFIKDKTGSVVIVEYKDGLRVHKPADGEQVVTNNWYDVEQEKAENGVIDYSDPRSFILRRDGQLPAKVNQALEAVGDPKYTQWRTLSERTQDLWKLTIKVKPLASDPEARRSVVLDLNFLFDAKNFPAGTQVVRFSEIKSNMDSVASLKWRKLEAEELRLIQLTNFKIVKENQEQLLGRNEERTKDSIAALNRILQQLKKTPLQ